MKKYILILFLGMIALASCKKDYLTTSAPPDSSLPPIDTTKAISYSASIAPIFVAKCMGSGCHINGGQSPVLTADKSYDQLTQLGYVDAATPDTIPANSKLYQRLMGTTKPMPPSGKLSSSITDAVALWIKQGSQNN